MMFTVADWSEVTWYLVSFLADFIFVGVSTRYLFDVVEQKILMILEVFCKSDGRK